MAELKWIKITTDIFDDEKILLIESMPEADSIIVIWLKLLCLAGKQNNDGVFLMNNTIPYTDKMLATVFRRKESTVQLALQTFQRFHMIEIINDTVTIPNWGKYQNRDRLDARREYMREYMQGYREKQALIASGEKQESCKVNSKANSKSNVNRQNRIDKNRIDKNREDIYIVEQARPRVSEIVAYLNERTGSHYKATSEKTKKLIGARIKEGFSLDDFKTVIDKKTAEWLRDPNMSKFLRPETLFGTKFESYLNQPWKEATTADLDVDFSGFGQFKNERSTTQP